MSTPTQRRIRCRSMPAMKRISRTDGSSRNTMPATVDTSTPDDRHERDRDLDDDQRRQRDAATEAI